MCGIVGYVGKRSAQDVLLDGLEKLEYRGYDSAGVALALDGGIRVVKAKGRLTALRERLAAQQLAQSFRVLQLAEEIGLLNIERGYVGGEQLPEGLTVKRIPAGRYAKFIVKGDMHQAVSDFWQALWTMDLDRAYTGDYEEYQNSDMEQAEIHMYIALR